MYNAKRIDLTRTPLRKIRKGMTFRLETTFDEDVLFTALEDSIALRGGRFAVDVRATYLDGQPKQYMAHFTVNQPGTCVAWVYPTAATAEVQS